MPECVTRLNPDGSLMGFVEESAHVGPNAYVNNTARVLGHASVVGGRSAIEIASVADEAIASEHATVYGSVGGQAHVSGHAAIWGKVDGGARVRGSAKIMPGGWVTGDAVVEGDAMIPSGAEIGNGAWIQSRLGYCGGIIGSQTWDAYTVWLPHVDGGKWSVAMRFACKALLLDCWEKEGNVAEHAFDISKKHSPYWIEMIERARDLAREAIVVPKVPPTP